MRGLLDYFYGQPETIVLEEKEPISVQKKARTIPKKQHNLSGNVAKLLDDGNHILDEVSQSRGIIEALGYPSDKCKLINTEINLGTKVGQGAYGSVYLVTFPNTEKEYVVKRANFDLQPYSDRKINIEKYFKKDRGLNEREIKVMLREHYGEYARARPNDMIKGKMYPFPCLTEKDQTYTNMDGSKNGVLVPKGSYICETEVFSEFIIGAYLGKLHRDGVCANFFDMYSMFTCPSGDADNWFQYIFMEKITGELSKFPACYSAGTYVKSNLSKEDIYSPANSMYCQTLFAIAAYQRIYKISHNDLHTGNVFLDLVNEKTEFEGQKIFDADWFHYKIDGNDIYIPASAHIIKIGDFGLTAKYTAPLVTTMEIISNGYRQQDKNGNVIGLPWTCNEYTPSYDSLFFSATVCGMLKSWDPVNTQVSPLMSECVQFMCNASSYNPRLNINDFLKVSSSNNSYTTWIQSSGQYDGRPIVSQCKYAKTAEQILLGPVLKKYGKKPAEGKIVTLGTI